MNETFTDPVVAELFQDQSRKHSQAQADLDWDRDRLLLALKNLLNTGDGKRFLYWLINQTGVFACTFTGNSQTFYLEGRRSVGLDVYKLLMAANPLALQELVNFRRREEKPGPDRPSPHTPTPTGAPT